jgi:hypothetical protein
LKKRSKKLLPMARASPAAHAKEQKFFGSFFQKRTTSFLALPYTSIVIRNCVPCAAGPVW